MIKEIILKKAKSMSTIEQLQYATTLVENGDFDSAFKIFCMAAEKGSIDAKYSMASCYYLGQGVKQDVFTQ